MCLSFSVSSAIGIYVQERTSLTGSREAKHASYEDAQKELAEIERKRKGLRQHRSVAEVEAAVAGVLARPIMVGERVRGTIGALSTSCTKDDRRTAASCAEVAGLREELAVADEDTKLQQRATALRAQIATVRGTGGSLAPDPVGLFWEWLTRGWITVRAVGFGLPLFFALMIETVSAFGPLAIAAFAEATRRHAADDTTRHVATRRALSRHGEGSRTDAMIIQPEMGQVVHFMADRTEPTADPAAISTEELHADYERWCNASALQPLSRDAFTTEFDRVRELPQLEGKIRKFGSRYYGLRLIEAKIARLPARKRSEK